jgi:hypothetical protein
MDNNDLKFYILILVCIINFFCCFTARKRIAQIYNIILFIIFLLYFQWVFLQRVGANTIIVRTHIQENGKKEIVQVRLVVNIFFPKNVRNKIRQEGWERLQNDVKKDLKIVRIELI